MKPNSRMPSNPHTTLDRTKPVYPIRTIPYPNFNQLSQFRSKSSFQGRIGSFKSPITHNTEESYPKGLQNSDLQRKSKFNKFESGESSRSACKGPPSPRREVYCEVDEISFTIPDRIQSEISTRRSLRGQHPICIQRQVESYRRFPWPLLNNTYNVAREGCPVSPPNPRVAYRRNCLNDYKCRWLP
ncbi:hypothetical protein FCV25MIE_02928 [Fagus crenata]